MFLDKLARKKTIMEGTRYYYFRRIRLDLYYSLCPGVFPETYQVDNLLKRNLHFDSHDKTPSLSLHRSSFFRATLTVISDYIPTLHLLGRLYYCERTTIIIFFSVQKFQLFFESWFLRRFFRGFPYPPHRHRRLLVTYFPIVSLDLNHESEKSEEKKNNNNTATA